MKTIKDLCDTLNIIKKRRYEIFTTYPSGVGHQRLVGEVECNPLEIRLKILWRNYFGKEIKAAHGRDVWLHPTAYYVFEKSRWATDEEYERYNGHKKPQEDFLKSF